MKAIIYLGFNNPYKFKRGVENVIAVQASSIKDVRKFYFCFDDEKGIYRWNDIICISLQHNFFWPFSFLFNYFKLSRRYDKIIIHCHNYLMGVLLPRKINVFSVHDGLTYQKEKIGKKFLLQYNIIEFLNYFKSKKIHFVSEFARSKALVKFFWNRTFIIYNSCSLEVKLKVIGNTDHELPGIRPRIILVVRSIEDRARIDLVVDLAVKLSFSDPDYQIVVIGKGPLLEKYIERVKELGLRNIDFKGFVSDNDLVRFYQNAYLIMVPAEYGEGFGLPVIEAYYFNKPVIASDVCAIPEVIIHRKYLFQNNSGSIIELIRKIDSYNTEFNFKEYYYKKFGLKIIRSQYQLIYDEIN